MPILSPPLTDYVALGALLSLSWPVLSVPKSIPGFPLLHLPAALDMADQALLEILISRGQGPPVSLRSLSAFLATLSQPPLPDRHLPITHRTTPGSVFSPLCSLCTQPRRAITRVKPNPPSLPTGSCLESSVWKWHHQLSQLFKPDSLESSSTYCSLLYLIQQQILLLPLLKSILLSTLGVITNVSHPDDCICSLTDASASTLVLNSIFPTVARTIL